MLFAIVVAAPLAAWAQDTFTGTWKIEKNEPAPWAKSADMLDAKEAKRLTGAAVEFKANSDQRSHAARVQGSALRDQAIPGRRSFPGCARRVWGSVDDSDKMADRIGFAKRPIASLVTGCASEIEFHAIDADHAVFALNNSIYRMARTPAADRPAAKSTP